MNSLEATFKEVSGRIIVAKVDVKGSLGRKLTSVTNIDIDEAFLHPHLRIIDPNQKNTAILKYKPLDEKDEEEEGITPSVILRFVNDYQKGNLVNLLKT